MKWKRKVPGEYYSGPWTVEGAGGRWTLLCNGEEIENHKSKKDCQDRAEELDGEVKKSKPTRKGPRRKNKEPQTITEAVEKGEGSVPLDSALRSLYLQLGQLTYSLERIASSLTTITQHTDLKRYK